MRKYSLIAAATIIAMLLSFNLIIGCGEEKDGEEKVVIIGLAGPLSGSQSQIGIDMRDGAELAVEDLNQQGGILGEYRVELIALDDKADPKEAVSVAQELSANKDIIAVVGHLNSGCSIPASNVYHDNELVMITPISTADELTQQGFDNIFRVCIRNSDQGPAAAKLAIEKLGKSNFYILDDKSAYGAGIANEFEKEAKKIGGTIIGRDSITEGETDFSAVLTKLKGKTIDMIYFGGMYPEGSLLVKQARELGIDAPLLGGDGLYAPKFIEVAKEAAEGSVVTHIAPLKATNAKAEKFFSDFKSRFGHDVLVYAPLSYDAVMIIAAAIEQSGKIDGKTVIETLHAPNFSYSGVIGTTQFDEKGDTLNKKPYFYVVRNGQFQLIE